jgi:8-oxo-dGTP diphosphatase
MARAPIFAAGGIVMRGGDKPLFAVVQLRKDNTWVLPKGKLGKREHVMAAARREAREETGHDVTVHEFLGTMSYESGKRPKIVQYWRMEASEQPAQRLMRDVKAVDWLPLKKAVEKLSLPREQAFLASVGPVALDNKTSGTPVSLPPMEFPPQRATMLARAWTWLRRRTKRRI